MSYTDRKITQAEINAHHVQGATDYLIGNPQQNKAVFDNLPEFIAGKFNDLIDEIEGQHGDEIKVAVDEWLAEHPEVTTTVQDNSLTTAKYVDGSVTPAKLDRTYTTPNDLSEVNANLTNEINVLDARMDEFASLPEGSTSGNAELLDIRVGADSETYPSAGDAVRGQVANLKSDLGQITVEKADTRQLYDNAHPNIINCYSNGLKFLPSSNHRILYIPCEPNTTYTISGDDSLWTPNGVLQSENEPVANGDCESFSARQDAIIVTENGRKYITNTTQANTHYLAVFYYNASLSPDTETNIRATIMIAKGENRTEYIPYGRLLYIREDRLPSTGAVDTVYDRCITGEEATMGTGDVIEFDSPNIKKNNLLTFSAIISNFGSLKIGQGRNALNQTAYIVIDATTVKVYRYTTEPVEWISLNHRLTIQDYIDVSIEVSNTEIGWAKLTVSSNGETFTYARMAWLGCGNVAYAEAVSGSYTNCVLKHYCADYDKEFWLFGDSYFDHWVTPALADGYNNFLCDGWSGRRAEQALPSLQILLEHGKPKYIVWCLGMNNGDSSVSVNANWLTAYNTLVELCEGNNINLILCTIPNTPSVNNNYKNAIIRNSGLQYIDLAKAVGSDISTSWYSGLLSTDNVHPSTVGDKMIAKFMETAIPQMFG